ncbi:hypothetical protein CC80DRAFT_572627 [Byssothecium circinans]|uniref:Carrier domain-containing protein n=1 Tax=Byssothecium circinans TaxID=147558 RepID=A0A6A5THR4_9PLEO|nr:hypothetical protein CC80DRAFT_572627 [Byssothecium circinans]
MSPAEASTLDPQQRHLLEGTFHTFENAGMPITELAGSNTSVFVGSFSRDMDAVLLRDPEYQFKYQATSAGSTMLSNRLSHFFDLRGPSLSIDTACSSGLYAFHLACRSLIQGESEMSLVAGSNTYFTPECFSIALDNGGFLSPDGISYSFDHRANGYARGEGFGFTLLKPLKAAIRDGDMIRAVVRATGANQDGRSPSITQPSPAAQIDLIRKTYERAGLDFATTRYVEAHGTGTPVGDPIEAKAIGEVFRAHRDPAHPLYVGSVKSNIGHLEGASGLAGILKTVLILERGAIPPNAWTEKVNPAIDTNSLRIDFPKTTVPWPTADLRRASVSSFGYGGANAHCILEDACNYLKSRGLKGLHQSVDLSKPPTNGPSNGLTNGHANGSGNGHVNGSTNEHLNGLRNAQSNGSANGHSGTSWIKTDSTDFKGLVVLSAADEEATSAADDLADKLSSVARASQAPNMHFVFTGQGAQWARMGLELLHYSVFRHSLDDCDVYLKSLGCKWSLLEELQRPNEGTQIHQPALSQPICTAVQVALVELFQSWKISPYSVAGHSSGEITAAFCVGALTREDAWKVAFHRGFVADKLRAVSGEPTTMMSVGLGENEVAPYLDRLGSPSDVTVGCINSPINVTLTGAKAQIDQLWAILDKEQVFVRKLAVDVAYHSKYMAAVAEEYQALMGGLKGSRLAATKSKSNTVIYSSVTGNAIDPYELSQPSYWVRNLVSPVRFADALTAMVKGGDFKARISRQAFHMVVEIGPQAALRRPVQDTLTALLKKEQWLFTPTLKANSSGVDSTLEAVGLLWAHGLDVDISSVNIASTHVLEAPELLVDLPARHQLLGLRAKDWNPGEASWRHFIRAQENPWVMDHGLNGSPLYPGSGILVMAIEAARQLNTYPEHLVTGYRLKDIRFLKAINIDSSEHGTEAQIHMRPRRLVSNSTAATWYDWRIYTLNGDDWVECAYGSVKVEFKSDDAETRESSDRRNAATVREKYQQSANNCSQSVYHEQMYNSLAKHGFSYGPYFRQLRTVKFNRTGNASATLALQGFADNMAYAGEDPVVIHPTTLDALCHLQMVALSAGGFRQIPTMIFSHLRELWVSQKLLTMPGNPPLSASTHETMRGFREAEYNTTALFADTQEPALLIEGERGTAITSLALSNAGTDEGDDGILFSLDFKPDLSLLNKEETRDVLRPRFNNLIAPPKEHIDRVEAIALYYVEKALKHLDQGQRSQDRAHLKWYRSWMAKVANDRARYALKSRGHANLPIEDVVRDVHLEPSQHLVARVGEKLHQILTGECDPLGVIFDGNLADDFYHSSVFTACSQKMGIYVQLLAHQNPHLKVLEVGAGTGSSTDQILSFLSQDVNTGHSYPRFSEYAYTDISTAFFEKARERLQKQAKHLNFKKLDMESDPIGQGFEAETYDVIIASNVLHVSSDLHQALKNIRKLLKPGGKLVLCEVVRESMRDSFVFGLLPGWWTRPNEQHLEQGPLLTEAQWAEMLPQCGFTGLDLSLRDHEDDAYHRMSVIVATASDEPHPNALSSPAPCYILRDEQSACQTVVAAGLREVLLDSFPTVEIIRSTLDDFEHSHLDLAGSTAISLLELEASKLSKVNNVQFEGLKRIALKPKQLLWVSNGGGLTSNNPYGEIVVGLGRAICSERGDQGFKVLNSDDAKDTARIVDVISRLVSRMATSTNAWDDSEFAIKNGIVHVPRITANPHLNTAMAAKTKRPDLANYTVGQPNKPHFTVTIGTPGLLDSIFYKENMDATRPLAPGEVEIESKTSSLNFKDLMHTLGQIPGQAIGFDGAGVVSRTGPGSEFSVGDRVMWCSSGGGGFGTFVRCSELQAIKIPDDMSFQVAASIPVVYHTVIYAFMHMTRLRKGGYPACPGAGCW